MDTVNLEPPKNPEDIDTFKEEFETPAEPGENMVPYYLANAEKAEWLKKTISEQDALVVDDQKSLVDWLAMRDKHITLFCGDPEPMKYPAEGAPGYSDPILIKTILMLVARGWDQICPSKGAIINVLPNGQEDEEAAQRRNDHMNFTMREKIPHYILGHLESYMQYAMSGSVFRAKWYDPVIGTSRFDHLTADDVIISYSRKDIDPLMRSVPRITRLRRYHRYELEAFGRAGYYHDVKRLWKEGAATGPSDDDASVLEDGRQETEGISAPTTVAAKTTRARVLKEVHCWLLLPGEEEMKPVMLTYDSWTKEALSLTLRLKDDAIDKARFDLETQAYDISSKNLVAEYQAAMDAHQQRVAAGQMLEPPAQPQMPAAPEPIRQVTDNTILHYRLFSNPQGFYGIGVAKLLEHPVELINACANEYLLGAKFNNVKTFFASSGAMGKRGEIKLKMGQINETKLEPSEMAGLKEINFSPPSDGLWKLLKLTQDGASSMIAAVDTMSGEAGPTNETRGAATQRHAEASQLVGNIVRMYLETMKEEGKMIAEDIGAHVPEMEMYWVTDPEKKRREQKTIKREDYANPFDFTFTADQRQQTQPERISSANQVIDRLVQSPFSKNPKGEVLFYEGFRELFTALGNDRMIAALGPQPTPQAEKPPPQPMAQEDENAGFFRDIDHPVFPTDPHEDHIVKLEGLIASPYYEHISATGKQMAQRHLAWHYGELYKQHAKGIQNGLHGQQGMAPGAAGQPPGVPAANGRAGGPPPGAGGQGPGQGPGGSEPNGPPVPRGAAQGV